MSKGDETKRSIVGEALGLASTVGLDKLTIGTLATATGMSKSGLFAHFKSKEQLQLQVLEEARRRYVDLVARPSFQKARGLERLRSVVELTLTEWERNLPGGCIFHAVAAEVDDQPGPTRDFVVEVLRSQNDMLARSTHMAVETGELRADLDVGQFVFELNAIVTGYHHAGRLLGDPHAERRARQMFDELVARAQ